MAWTGLTGSDVRHWHSEAESRRFDMPIGRVVVGYDAVPGPELEAQVRSVVESASDELLVVRYPSAFTRVGAQFPGREVIPADVLMYWEIDAAPLADVEPREGLVAEVAIADDESRDALKQVLLDSFRGYGSHYTANPRLDPELALEGYLEWALGAFEKDPQNAIILRADGAPVGIATLSPADDHLEIELAGLSGASQGQGWYRHLLVGVGQEALRRGLDRVVISTQAANIRVQRAWVNAGMKPFASVTTVHATKL